MKRKIIISIIICFVFFAGLSIYGVDTKILKKGESITIDGPILSIWGTGDNSIIELSYNYFSGNVTITGLKAGETTFTNYSYDNIPTSYTIKVTDEEQELEDKIKDAEKTKQDMQNAYKTVPKADATATEILNFINSDITYNGGKAIATVPKDTLNKWKETCGKAMVDTISRQMYQAVTGVIDETINGNGVQKFEDVIKQKTEDAQKATETTIKDYKIMLGSLRGDNSGTDRTGDFTDDVINDYNSYKPGNIDVGSKSKVEKIGGTVLKVVSNIGIVASVLIIAVLGIKYMLGSVEDKAEYKKDLVPYFIGAVVLFGITTIVKVLMALGSSINNI